MHGEFFMLQNFHDFAMNCGGCSSSAAEDVGGQQGVAGALRPVLRRHQRQRSQQGGVHHTPHGRHQRPAAGAAPCHGDRPAVCRQWHLDRGAWASEGIVPASAWAVASQSGEIVILEQTGVRKFYNGLRKSIDGRCTGQGRLLNYRNGICRPNTANLILNASQLPCQ